MPVMCFGAAVAYFPVPKAACTSIKLAMFEIDHGYPVTAKIGPDPENRFIHWYLQTEPFRPDVANIIPKHFAKIAVIRDPVGRFVSGYRNRIVHLGEAAWAGGGLPARPDIDTFARLLPEYVKVVPAINHHFAQQTGFIGRDLGWFDRVFGFDRLPELETFLSERAGRPINIGVTQNQGPALSTHALRPETMQLLQVYYVDDFALYRRFSGHN